MKAAPTNGEEDTVREDGRSFVESGGEEEEEAAAMSSPPKKAPGRVTSEVRRQMVSVPLAYRRIDHLSNS